MSRIAKSDVNAALAKAAQNIKDAAGADKISSRDDVKAKLLTLTGSEKALTDVFFRFIDHRDAAPNARVTGSDVDNALAYAKEHLLAKYDVNNNGFSKAEIAKMSRTGQLAVQLAAETRGIKLPTDPTPSSALGQAVTAAAKDCDYISETDSTPTFVSANLNGSAVTGDQIIDAFKSTITATLDFGEGVDFSKVTFAAFTPSESADFISGLATNVDPNDPDSIK
ncbi:MAG TPA: hypothetical protein VGO62_14690, partial [Myxococcota bacterium]